MTDLGQAQALYERVCESYHAVDDFRMKLLGLLPVATGTAVFLLLNGKADLLGGGDAGESTAGDANAKVSDADDALLAIGVFGLMFTLGLFAFELFGIKKCHYLIVTGQRLEEQLRVEGQFRSRPRDLAGFVNEPYASAIIYPASMAAWAFLAVAPRSAVAGAVGAGAVFVVGYALTVVGARRINENQEREQMVLGAFNPGDRIKLDELKGKARGWESRHRRPPPPKGLPWGWHRLKQRAGGVKKWLLARLRLKQPDWVETVVLRLHARGDLDLDERDDVVYLPPDELVHRSSAPAEPITPADRDNRPRGMVPRRSSRSSTSALRRLPWRWW